MLMAIGVTAMCQLLAAGTKATIDSTEMSSAINLAGAMHDLSTALPLNPTGRFVGRFQTVWDLNGKTFAPVVDVSASPMAGFDAWEQRLEVAAADDRSLGAIALPGERNVARVVVRVFHNSHQVYMTSWLCFAHRDIAGEP